MISTHSRTTANNTLTYNWIADSGHAWLKVSMEEINALNIRDKISIYSYYDAKNGDVYLEEDCDAGIFLDALKERLPRHEAVHTTITHIEGDAPCRSFKRFGQ